MSQTDISLRPNNVRVFDCIEWLLQQIKPENSSDARPYYTDGVVVDRKRDPRNFTQDLKTEVERVGSFIRIKEGDGKLQRGNKGYVGNSQRTLGNIELVCWSILTEKQDKAGIVADQLTGWLRHDVAVALSNDDDGTTCILRAAENLAITPPKGLSVWGSAPSCIGLESTGWLVGSMSTFPMYMQVIQLEYLYDEHGSGRIPGVP